MKGLATGLWLVVACIAGVSIADPARGQKKGPNEAVLRHVEQAAAELEAGIELLRERSLLEARKLLTSVVNHTHRAGKILVDVGPTDSQLRAIGLVLHGTLLVEEALDRVDEAIVTAKKNAKERLKEENASFKLAKAESKAVLKEAVALAKVEKAAAALGLELVAATVAEQGQSDESPVADEDSDADGAVEAQDADNDAKDEPSEGEGEDNGDEDDGEQRDDEDEEEEEFVDPEVEKIVFEAQDAALEGQELLARGLEVFPRRF